MTTTSWIFLALSGALACGDWLAVSEVKPSWRRLEYVFKPATLVAVIGLCASVRTTEGSARTWFLVALAFCLVGDIALMLPGRKTSAFAGGLSAFLLGHGAFIVGFVRGGARIIPSLVALVALAAAFGVPAGVVVRSIRRSHPVLLGPVLLYIGALLVMAATACSIGVSRSPGWNRATLIAGAICFAISDTTLAFDRFVRPFRRSKFVVHATYHGAVLLLVVSLVP
jgi:uncharacterized membrane protein YhhN